MALRKKGDSVSGHPEASGVDWPLTVALPGRHVVEASAGTGKTFTIATLHLRFVVEAGFPVSRVLVATFTEAATAELKDRLRRNLALARGLVGASAAQGPAEEVAFEVLSRVGAAGADLNDAKAAAVARRLDRALSAFDGAPVFTLHGFCQRLLTELAFESGARFEEEVLTDVRPLLDAAVADFADSAFGDPASPLAGATPAKAKEWEPIRLAAKLAVEHPEAGLEPGVDLPAAAVELDRRARPVEAAWAQRREAIEAELRTLSPGFHKVLSSKLEEHLGALDRAIAQRSWRAVPEALCATKLRSKVKTKQPAPQDPIYADLEAVRNFALSPALDLEVAARSAVACEARVRVAELKRAGGLMGFDDMLQRVAAALADPETGPTLAAEVRRRYPVAMIDEVQDTDPLQHRILERLFGDADGAPGRSFLSIGDPKQSIYRFRGADVGGFVETRERTPEANRHGLQTNFRTDAPLVAAAQAVFSTAGPKPFGATGISLPTVAAAHPKRTVLTPALDVAWVGVGEEGGEKLPLKPSATRKVVRSLVGDVVSLLAEAPDIDGRPLRAGDLAVLCEKNKQVDAVAAALAAVGVPAVRPSGDSVFVSPEAHLVVDLAVAWLDPTNKPRLRRAMLGPVLGAEPGSLDDPGVLAAAASLAGDCGRRWRRSGFAAALHHAMSAAGTVCRLAGEPRGERRLTNLAHLGELLEQMAREEGLEPEALLARLRSAMRRPGEAGTTESAELRLESDAAAVKLLTIHRSKGLEFPVVFLPFLWDGGGGKKRVPVLDRPRAGEQRASILDLGSDQLGGRQLLEQLDQQEEKLRLLYVALTRAKHQTRVHWAATGQTGLTPLGGLMCGDTSPKSLKTEADWHAKLADWADRVAAEASADLAVQGFEPEAWPTVVIRDAEASPSPRRSVVAESDTAKALALRPLTHLPPPALRSSSFSSLTSGGHASAPEPVDRDSEPGHSGAAAAVGEQEATPGPIDAMPGGTGVGLLVHAVLEEALVDSSPVGDDVSGWCRARVAATGPVHGLDPDWHDPLGDALAATLTRPLPLAGPDEPAVALLETEPGLRSIELPFVLAAGSPGGGEVHVDAIARVLERSNHPGTRETAERLRRTEARPIAGLLEGFIDLVVPVGDRWHVVDHKSNRVPAGYGHAALEAAMVRSMYLLQGHLYLAALHRLLAGSRAGYDPATHLGGMAYLFVRGIAAGGVDGVYAHRPEHALIEALAEVLS